ncbi:DUF4397 domain-containing protein [Pedobacter cryotolerans]|uniref:DUF4397 domain-containing protein n=1 Tax=Pedobacter cryotolerans TaxID=2571270 RepID=A0A4U1CAV2_9SPHI|nr:DUF4397 domain-containing protein [Pedobacter cryotolerans]TKC02070.1 DUF4397 domain-containing protein [Pedobacter cryotolerans]
MRKFYSLILFFLTITTIISCKKQEVDTTAYTAIAVVNASPTSATYDVYLGANKINAAALPSGGGVSYVQQVAGNYDLKFTVAGRGESVLTRTVNLEQNKFQSFYLIGSPTSFDGIFTVDDLTATSTTQAFVRFINLSPDAPALSLAVTGGAAVGSSQAYKGISTFVQVAPGAQSFELKDNSAVVRATLTGVNLVANGYYTIIAKGLVTPVTATDLPLAAQLIVTK